MRMPEKSKHEFIMRVCVYKRERETEGSENRDMFIVEYYMRLHI